MIKSLYPKFQSWAEKGAIWIISDPHFDDPDCKIMNPNWPDAQDYINQIKPKIGKYDTLICLGDVGNPKYFNRLDCYKVLITGNHDSGVSNYLKGGQFLDFLYPDDAKKLVQNNKELYIGERHGLKVAVYARTGYFDEVYNGPLFIADRILLSHEPIYGLENICINIHGHVHNAPIVPDEGHINLAADNIGWRPINLGLLIKNGFLSATKNYHKVNLEKYNATRLSLEKSHF